ncbi:uncharacterized protein LOC133195245 [Saccostrea echinata]|uniref:uncharacterized protein LOC133195245 n=1 Tax=Saccostrea echinata TaxID=191078 RepID=UPI002A810BCC|nr:uncharacterized protein LOC133195245 [Saccostrea echinata]
MDGRGNAYKKTFRSFNKSSKNNETTLKSNPTKRSRPNSDSDMSQNMSQDLSDLSDILDNISNDDGLLQQATNIILNKPALKNSIIDRMANEVRDLKDRVSELENRVDDLEQYSRKTCLKFTGIPEMSDENTNNVILNTINKCVLNEGQISLNVNAISTSHRLGPPRQDRPRDIIVRFVRYSDKVLVYNNKSNLKGWNDNPTNGYKIYINEALTRRRSMLFAKTREAVRNHRVKGCWTYDGKIYIKKNNDKKAVIKNITDLDRLIVTNTQARETIDEA